MDTRRFRRCCCQNWPPCFAEMLCRHIYTHIYTLSLQSWMWRATKISEFLVSTSLVKFEFSCRLEATIEAQSKVSGSTLDPIFPSNFRTVFHGMILTLLIVFFLLRAARFVAATGASSWIHWRHHRSACCPHRSRTQRKVAICSPKIVTNHEHSLTKLLRHSWPFYTFLAS